MKRSNNTTTALKDDLSNLASFVALEAATLAEQTKEGEVNPAAHILPASLTAVLGADAKVQHCWKVYSEAAVAAGMDTTMLPNGAKYLSKAATPEYNLLYSTVATARFGKDCAALMNNKEAILAGKDDERNKQQAAVGKVIGYIRGHIERAKQALLVTSGDTDSDTDDKAASVPRGAKKRTNALQAALDGEVIILLKDMREFIKDFSDDEFKAFRARIDALLAKAKAPEIDKAA